MLVGGRRGVSRGKEMRRGLEGKREEVKRAREGVVVADSPEVNV